jgi:hypothetical protein
MSGLPPHARRLRLRCIDLFFADTGPDPGSVAGKNAPADPGSVSARVHGIEKPIPGM